MLVETYRLYFNCREDAPNVWSYDRGPGTEEHIVRSIKLFWCSAVFKTDLDKHWPEASAWMEVRGHLIETDGNVRIYGTAD